MLSYGFALVSDLEELSEVIKGVNRNTLGSGTLAGNPFEIDRDLITKELGFIPDSTNSRYYENITVQCVAKLEKTGIPMNELSLEQLKAIDSRLEEDIAEALVYETSVERKSANGSTSKPSVLEQIQVIKEALSGIRV
ncbi:hypothetical protein GGI42DRAFT_358847 [Trichoderma sp. SZMC 28013]